VSQSQKTSDHSDGALQGRRHELPRCRPTAQTAELQAERAALGNSHAPDRSQPSASSAPLAAGGSRQSEAEPMGAGEH